MLNLDGKYLRNLHTSLLPVQPANQQSYDIQDEERAFERTSKFWTAGIFTAMVVVGGSLIALYISTLPY